MLLSYQFFNYCLFITRKDDLDYAFFLTGYLHMIMHASLFMFALWRFTTNISFFVQICRIDYTTNSFHFLTIQVAYVTYIFFLKFPGFLQWLAASITIELRDLTMG